MLGLSDKINDSDSDSDSCPDFGHVVDNECNFKKQYIYYWITV